MTDETLTQWVRRQEQAARERGDLQPVADVDPSQRRHGIESIVDVKIDLAWDRAGSDAHEIPAPTEEFRTYHDGFHREQQAMLQKAIERAVLPASLRTPELLKTLPRKALIATDYHPGFDAWRIVTILDGKVLEATLLAAPREALDEVVAAIRFAAGFAGCEVEAIAPGEHIDDEIAALMEKAAYELHEWSDGDF